MMLRGSWTRKVNRGTEGRVSWVVAQLKHVPLLRSLLTVDQNFSF